MPAAERQAPVSEPYEPESRPGTILPGQRVRILIAMEERGLKQREDRLRELGNITGREIESTNDLSYREAADVILALARAGAR